MNRRILNYELQAEGRQMIQIPCGSDVIGVVEKYGIPFLLAIVDETQRVESRIFRIATTGERFNDERLFYIGTLRLGGQGKEPWYTAHVFEIETALLQRYPDPIEDRFKDDLLELRRETAAVALEDLNSLEKALTAAKLAEAV
jgi:hypothetical protein